MPPFEQIGALPVDRFLPKKARRDLAAALNSLIASPTFSSWRQGAPLDVASWMKPVPAAASSSSAAASERAPTRTPATILSVAHLDDDERALVLGMVLEEVLSWVRGLPGAQSLRALIVFDEVFGFRRGVRLWLVVSRPHPPGRPQPRVDRAHATEPRTLRRRVARCVASADRQEIEPSGSVVECDRAPPLRRPGRSELPRPRAAQRRRRGASLDLGEWCAQRSAGGAERAHRGGQPMHLAHGENPTDYDHVLKHLEPRMFLVRNAHHRGPPRLVQPRWAMSYLRGPMTRSELRRVMPRAHPRGPGARPGLLSST